MGVGRVIGLEIRIVIERERESIGKERNKQGL